MIAREPFKSGKGGLGRCIVFGLLILIAMATLSVTTSAVEDEPGRIKEVIERTIPRVVKIWGASGIRNVPGYASGVIVSPEGEILTQDAILLRAENLRVVLSDGTVLPAKVLRRDTDRAVTLIKVEADDPLPFFEAKDPGPLRVGQMVLSVGNAFELAQLDEWPTVHLGIVSSVTRLDLRLGVNDFPYRGAVIVTDANNNPGSYGGALVDIEGRLIGINGRMVESKETNTQISYAIPIQDLLALIDGSIILLKGDAQEKTPGRHGIRLFDVRIRKSAPAYVSGVERDSPAARAGIRKDDLIIRCGPTTVKTCKDFREVMARFRPDEEVPITIKRGDEIHQVVIRLAAPQPKGEIR